MSLAYRHPASSHHPSSSIIQQQELLSNILSQIERFHDRYPNIVTEARITDFSAMIGDLRRALSDEEPLVKLQKLVHEGRVFDLNEQIQMIRGVIQEGFHQDECLFWLRMYWVGQVLLSERYSEELGKTVKEVRKQLNAMCEARNSPFHQYAAEVKDISHNYLNWIDGEPITMDVKFLGMTLVDELRRNRGFASVPSVEMPHPLSFTRTSHHRNGADHPRSSHERPPHQFSTRPNGNTSHSNFRVLHDDIHPPNHSRKRPSPSFDTTHQAPLKKQRVDVPVKWNCTVSDDSRHLTLEAPELNLSDLVEVQISNSGRSFMVMDKNGTLTMCMFHEPIHPRIRDSARCPQLTVRFQPKFPHYGSTIPESHRQFSPLLCMSRRFISFFVCQQVENVVHVLRANFISQSEIATDASAEFFLVDGEVVISLTLSPLETASLQELACRAITNSGRIFSIVRNPTDISIVQTHTLQLESHLKIQKVKSTVNILGKECLMCLLDDDTVRVYQWTGEETGYALGVSLPQTPSTQAIESCSQGTYLVASTLNSCVVWNLASHMKEDSGGVPLGARIVDLVEMGHHDCDIVLAVVGEFGDESRVWKMVHHAAQKGGMELAEEITLANDDAPTKMIRQYSRSEIEAYHEFREQKMAASNLSEEAMIGVAITRKGRVVIVAI